MQEEDADIWKEKKKKDTTYVWGTLSTIHTIFYLKKQREMRLHGHTQSLVLNPIDRVWILQRTERESLWAGNLFEDCLQISGFLIFDTEFC